MRRPIDRRAHTRHSHVTRGRGTRLCLQFRLSFGVRAAFPFGVRGESLPVTARLFPRGGRCAHLIFCFSFCGRSLGRRLFVVGLMDVAVCGVVPCVPPCVDELVGPVGGARLSTPQCPSQLVPQSQTRNSGAGRSQAKDGDRRGEPCKGFVGEPLPLFKHPGIWCSKTILT